MKTLFALLLVITVAATLSMSWIARDFKLHDGGKFSIMHLELPTGSDGINQLMAAFAPGTKEAVIKQLNTDYIFMAACYPGIMVLCLIAINRINNINGLQKDLNKEETGKGWKKLLFALVFLQLLSWGLDVWENTQLESWLRAGAADDNTGFLRARTYVKFGIGFAGFLTPACLLLLTTKLPEKLKRQKLTSTLTMHKSKLVASAPSQLDKF